MFLGKKKSDPRIDRLLSNKRTTINKLLLDQQVKTKDRPSRFYNNTSTKKTGKDPASLSDLPKLTFWDWTKLSFFFNFLAIIFLLVSYFYFSNKPLQFVSGYNSSPYSQFELINILGIANTTFDELDSYAISQKLNSLHWVKQAKLKKVPPALAVFFVEGRIAEAILVIDKKKYLIDSDQVLLTDNLQQGVKNLPELRIKSDLLSSVDVGIKVDNFNLVQGFNWLDHLKTSTVLNISAVEFIDISNPYRFEIKTTNNIRVIVFYDKIEDQLAKLSFINNYMQQVKQSYKIIDLRISDRAIIN